ncbi:MAG: HDOD domain-containing protein [Lentisphaeraceae bacterium]|nr:HDOD domain-containing protein [Lentisphaeraceae bacterium]
MSVLLQQKILQSIQDVPCLPLTALKIIRLANDINSPPHEMLETIKVDPMITAKVLKMINSSYFGLGANITDLRQALVMLGNNTVKNLALSSALLNTMKAKKTGHEKLDLDAVWLHSLGVAVASKIIAKAAKLPKIQHDEYFIIGLLHDIGTIFSFQFLADEYLQILDLQEDLKNTLDECESNILSMTIPQTGALLAEKWQLPENIRAGIRYHRHPEQAGDHSKSCAIINVATYFANELGIGWQEIKAEPLNNDNLKLIGIKFDCLLEPMQELSQLIDAAKDFIQD